MINKTLYPLAMLLAGVCFASAAQAEDWGAFLGPRGDGTSAEKGVDPELWQPHPPIVWTLPLGVSYGGPTVVGDRLLQFDRWGEKERLTCYDVNTQKELWRWEAEVQYVDNYGYNNGPRCSPVVADGLVFVYGVAGQLSCVDLESGRLKWSKDTLQEYSVVQNFFGVASTPYVFEDKLLVMVGGSPAESSQVPSGRLDLVKSNGSAIVAFDTQSGKELYRLGDDLASYAALTVRQIDGKPTGLAFCRGGLIAWDPTSGQQLFNFSWRAPTLESVNAALPVTQGNQILLSEAYAVGSVLLKVDQSRTSVTWKDAGRRNDCKFRAHWATPILIGDYLYGCSGRNQSDSDFRCIRLSDGEVQWTDRRHERSSLLAIDGYLVVLGEYGRLELIRPTPEKLEVIAECDLSAVAAASDGQPLLDYPCWAPPVFSDGKLYVRGNKRMVCLQLIP